MSSVGEVQTLYRDLFRAARFVRPDEQHTLLTLPFALRDFLDDKARDLVRRSEGRPIVYSYQADATSFLCVHTQRSRDKSVSRAGNVLQDMLLERVLCSLAQRAGVWNQLF